MLIIGGGGGMLESSPTVTSRIYSFIRQPCFGATTEYRANFSSLLSEAARRLASRIKCLKNEKGT